MQEQFDSLARDLARGGVTRGRFLRLLGGLGGAAGLAAVGIRTAGAQEEGDPLMTSGHTRSQLEALRRTSPSPQAICARTDPAGDQPCPLTICSTTCPEGLLDTGICLQPADNRGRRRCAAVFACSGATPCESNADCGPREFCAVTCCPGSRSQCAPICG